MNNDEISSTTATAAKSAASETSHSIPTKGSVAPEFFISKQPPSHLFVDEWSELELQLHLNSGLKQTSSPRDSSKVLDSFPSELPELKAELCSLDESKTPIILSPDVFETSSTIISSSTTSKRIKYQFRISPTVDLTSSYFLQLYNANRAVEDKIKSKSFRLITSKLVVDAIDWEDIWYKDEGGRDKCMQVEVSLCNAKNMTIKNKRIQLKVTLLYDSNDIEASHAKVFKQDILNVFGSPRQFIDPETAKTTLRFRVEDVSKNHQGQNFVLQIAPEPSKGNLDVAPAYTPSVSVRSKRSKRQRTSKDTQYGYETSTSPGPSHAMSIMNNSTAPGGIPATPIASHPSRHSSVEASSPNFDGVEDIASLREAMRGVVRWTEEVINGLYPLQWQVIGYAQYPDGTLDYNRPYHSMPNPNARISKILSMYSDATREQLRVLLSAVERSDSSKRIPAPNENEYVEVRQGAAGVHHFVPNATPLARQEPVVDKHVHHASSIPPVDPMMMQERDDIQSDVEYVLATHYKSTISGNFFGFPAFNERQELLGFYQESRSNVGIARFVPISSFSSKDLSPIELSQATSMLIDSMKNNRDAVYSLKDWGNISTLLDRVLVYDWQHKAGRVQGNEWWRMQNNE